MRSLRTLISITIVLLISACSSTRVQTDYDHHADFSSYSTFAWYRAAEDGKSPTEGPNQIVDQRIRGAISENLRAKGFNPNKAKEADLLVTYYTSLNSQMNFHTTGWGYGYGWGWGPYWSYGYGFWPGWTYTTVHTYHERTVIIDIIDRSTNQLVWRGVGTAALGKKSHSEEKIGQSMTRVLESFPPA